MILATLDRFQNLDTHGLCKAGDVTQQFPRHALVLVVGADRDRHFRLCHRCIAGDHRRRHNGFFTIDESKEVLCRFVIDLRHSHEAVVAYFSDAAEKAEVQVFRRHMPEEFS